MPELAYRAPKSRMRILGWPARKNAAWNPFQKLLYDAVEAESDQIEVVEFSIGAALSRSAPDILHIHWPDAFLAAGTGWRFWPRYVFLRGGVSILKARGTKIVWTAHNLKRDGQRHGGKMQRLFWPWFLKTVDGVIFMTCASAADAAKSVPSLTGTPQAVIPHGDYLPVIGALAPLPPKGRPTALFFGSVSRYKNAWQILESFLELPAGTARLRICGKMSPREPDTRLEELLSKLPLTRADEVHFDNRFLPESELVSEVRAADLVVFPYSDVLNSGAAIFALSAGRPILASNTALFQELQQSVGEDWVRLIKGTLDGEQLGEALTAARHLRDRNASPDLSSFSWRAIGRQTSAFYRRLLDEDSSLAAKKIPAL